MKTVRLTMAQALVRYLTAQRAIIDDEEVPLFAGVFAIFGHGNVTCLAEALEPVQDVLPTLRGQNEQSMALAAIAFAKARRRRQMMVATSSVGPGATNLITAAAVAHSNRLPVLLLSGDTFNNRLPDPVLQQVEHFDNPTRNVNDAFLAVTRYWDRITTPEQLITSLPHAVAMLLDPADCGPAFLGLPQDVQAMAFDYPEVFFAPTVHRIRRQRPDTAELAAAATILRSAKKPVLIAGGGVHYSGATAELADFAEQHALPVVETIAGRASLTTDHPANAGPLGIVGSESANNVAKEADVVVAVGTRLQDFTTGSWSVFGNPDMRLVSINVGRFDATKHRASSVVGDAKASLAELSERLAGWRAPDSWLSQAADWYGQWNRVVDAAVEPTDAELPSYARVVGAANRLADDGDLALCASGGLVGELVKAWRSRKVGTFDAEFGYSCMGYEIAGGWGAAMANPERDVIVFVGDGAYLMMNSDLYSSVLTGHKMIVVVCDNGGFGVINRLQVGTGGASFNNLLEHSRVQNPVGVDFAKHAEAMGAHAEQVKTLAEFEQAFGRAKAADRTAVIVIKTNADEWTPGDAWWEVGVPEVSERREVRDARSAHEEGKKQQRVGV